MFIPKRLNRVRPHNKHLIKPGCVWVPYLCAQNVDLIINMDLEHFKSRYEIKGINIPNYLTIITDRETS